jgi:hypothetical protein
MANEPNNAEEQLKQYAGERRQQVPQEIHPATRNLLQGEVRRTYGSPEEEQRSKLRLRWLQALAWIAILAAIPLFLLPRSPKENVQEATPARPGAVPLPTEKRKGEAPIVLSDTKEPVAPIIVAPTAVPPPASVTAPIKSREGASDELARRLNEMPRARAITAAAAANNSNSKLLFANSVSNQQVLNRFHLEQTGERLKITEANDGSVYSGRVFSQAAGADNFQAAGFNRTLNQAVILTGQVVRVQTAAAQQQPQSSRISNSQDAAAGANSVNNNSQDVRVQGNAIIGNTQYKVDAQAAPGQ